MLTTEQNFYKMRGNQICSTMAWEQRKNNNYYYRKVRRGNKVSSVYIGKDILEYNLSGRAHKQNLLNQKQITRITNEEAVDLTFEAHNKAIIAIAEATLLVNGDHLHKGNWRKRHEKRSKNTN